VVATLRHPSSDEAATAASPDKVPIMDAVTVTHARMHVCARPRMLRRSTICGAPRDKW